MKISVIMQSYLGDYPGSRTNPEEKFIRAVRSFLDQTHDDKELIIISDGCRITESLYYNYFKNIGQSIKFHYLEKSGPNMFENINGSKLFRGTPKKIGCEIASGDIISYLDSDDFILKNRLSDINKAWEEKGSNAEYGGCASRLLPILDLENYLKNRNKEEISVDIFNLSSYGIKSYFFSKEPHDGLFFPITCHHTHRKGIPILWEDSIDKFEDVHFLHRIFHYYRNNPEKIFSFNSKTYVLCHRNSSWDY
jgi:glycosyltransferase involved in cell wall biosynthesis